MSMSFVLVTSLQDSYNGTVSKVGVFVWSGVLQKVTVIF